jgi:hypothetical protein
LPLRGRPRFSTNVTIEVWKELEIARQPFASTQPHYLSHPGTRFLLRAIAGDPALPIAEPGTFRRRDRSISFSLRPFQRHDIIFAFSSPVVFIYAGVLASDLISRPGKEEPLNAKRRRLVGGARLID